MMPKRDRDRGSQGVHGVEVGMEAVNGATVILPDAGGAEAQDARGSVVRGPGQTGEAYVVIVGAMPAGDAGPPLHIYPHTDEAFYIAEGEMTFQLGDREVVGGTGAFVFVPRGMIHTARNSGPRPMPGGDERIATFFGSTLRSFGASAVSRPLNRGLAGEGENLLAPSCGC
jgi:mannose-6-phosphate isomerase-like protein (cupin superfamily)